MGETSFLAKHPPAGAYLPADQPRAFKSRCTRNWTVLWIGQTSRSPVKRSAERWHNVPCQFESHALSTVHRTTTDVSRDTHTLGEHLQHDSHWCLSALSAPSQFSVLSCALHILGTYGHMISHLRQAVGANTVIVVGTLFFGRPAISSCRLVRFSLAVAQDTLVTRRLTETKTGFLFSHLSTHGKLTQVAPIARQRDRVKTESDRKGKT